MSKRLVEAAYAFPEGSKLWQDTGLQGYELAGVTTLQPQQQPRQQACSTADKQRQQERSRARVEVEH